MQSYFAKQCVLDDIAYDVNDCKKFALDDILYDVNDCKKFFKNAICNFMREGFY